MKSNGKLLGKRTADLVIASIALLCFSPIILILFLLVRVNIGKPALFVQDRIGQDGAEFQIRKFRSMSDERDEKGELLPDEERLGRFGKWLRSSSLDELPELWNVLKGEMSMVGPRPLLPEYLPLYNDFQNRRHEVKPGLTGWAQINGRNAHSWNERFERDVWYVEHQSFWLDIRILWNTVWTVMLRDGVSAEGHATMPKFTGNE